METALLKTLVASKMREYFPKGKLWPNGLGFEYRGGSFSYSEQDGKWYYAADSGAIQGKGENPFDAYAHAKHIKD